MESGAVTHGSRVGGLWRLRVEFQRLELSQPDPWASDAGKLSVTVSSKIGGLGGCGGQFKPALLIESSWDQRTLLPPESGL